MIEGLMRKYLTGFAARRVLDAGPGYSDFARIAASVCHSESVTYIDYDDAVLQWQQQKCQSINLPCFINKSLLTVDNIQSIQETYDLILLQEVLEHLINAEEILQIFSHILSPRGRIIITTPTKQSEIWIKKINPDYMKNEPFGHARQFDDHDLQEMVQKAGLEVITFHPTQPHFYVYHTWLFGTRQPVRISTGSCDDRNRQNWLLNKIRGKIGSFLLRNSKRLFKLVFTDYWCRLIPRNYFLVAGKKTS